MSRILSLALALAMLPAILGASALSPGDSLVANFTMTTNTADILLFFSNDPLTVTGSPVFTTNLYNGQTLLGTHVTKPRFFDNKFFFSTAFVSPTGGSGVASNLPAKVDFTSINNGTISGRLVTTVAGGSVSGFDMTKFFLYDALSVANGYRPLSDLVRTSLNLLSAPSLPHLAAGETWTSGIFVINTGSQAANFSIAFRDDDGNAAMLPFTNGSANTISGTVPARGSSYFEAGDPRAPLKVAWGQAIADSNIVIQGLFRNNVNGTYYEAAVPSSTGTKTFAIAFDATKFAPTDSPTYTGMAIANLDGTNPANVACTVRNAAGNIIPNAVAVPMVRPLGHWAGYVFPALTGQRGTIDCASDVDISVIALRFLGSNAFSTLPVVLR